jgi:arylsulfatase A-like enzyme
VIPPGKSNRLVDTGIDLIPTICGVAVPPGLPGISLRHPEMHPRRYVISANKLVQGAPIDGKKPTPSGRMLRSQRFKYCAYDEGKRRESLVDMQTDPGEM